MTAALYKHAIKAVHQLYRLPDSLRTEFYDSEIAPVVDKIATFLSEDKNESLLELWLYLQYATMDFAVEGITDMTFQFFKDNRKLLGRLIETMPLEQKIGLESLFQEFEGRSDLLLPEFDNASFQEQLSSAAFRNLDMAIPFSEPPSGIQGEFSGTSTFQSNRGFPVIHGKLTLLAPGDGEPQTYLANTGGGSKNFMTRNGPLPPGTYRVSNHRPNRKTVGMVHNNIGFSFDLDPINGTEVYSRSLFRIHPDGGSKGTNGCIGIRASGEELQACERSLVKLLKKGPVKIRVHYSSPL